MFGKSQVSDKDLLRTITQRIARTGSSQSKVSAAVQRGTVTLTGSLYAETQRMQILRVAGQIEGVRTVVDQMTVAPKRKF